MNISLAILMVLNLKFILQLDKKEQKLALVINIILTTIILLFSINNDNNLNAARYYLISNLIIFAYFQKPDIKYLKIFDFFVFLQALVVIFFEIYLVFNFTPENYYPIRSALIENNWGEVFLSKEFIWNIGIRGNALLPFAFILSFYRKQKFYYRSILFVAILFAGNFAYIAALAIFLIIYIFFWCRNKPVHLLGFFVLFFIILVFFGFQYIDGVIASKADYSNAIRVEQFYILINDLFYNKTAGLFGNGFGNNISLLTSLREYDSKIGFELIWLYFMNQVGIIYFIFFIILNVFLSFSFIQNKYLILIYALYIFYSLWNPQFLDTTHVVVIIILVTLNKLNRFR
jgi:hypothetical protein